MTESFSLSYKSYCSGKLQSFDRVAVLPDIQKVVIVRVHH